MKVKLCQAVATGSFCERIVVFLEKRRIEVSRGNSSIAVAP